VIAHIEEFLQYFANLRRRTMNYLRTVPPGALDYAPKEGEFRLGEIIRHLGAAERMFTAVVAGEPWQYPGHSPDGEESLEAALLSLETAHEECTGRLRALGDAVLSQKRPTLKGPPVSAWRLLMVMAEHEIHHRSQIAVYLALLGVEPPQIYGLSLEDILALTAS
jgi:uncharacterized damage-inducible protein DinB